MKAPEKLYLRKRNKLPLEVVRDKWYETDPQSLYGSVEYTRTDAFIEKAKKWFEKQNEWHDINGIKHCNMEDFEDFRKYMEE